MIFYAVTYHVTAQPVTIPDTASVSRLLVRGVELSDSDRDSAVYYYHRVISGFRDAEQGINYKNLSKKELEYLKTVIQAYNLAGNVYYYDDQYQRAETYYLQSLQIARKAALNKYIAKALFDIGYIRYVNNNYKESKKLFEESYRIYTELNNRKGMYNATNACGLSEYHLGNYLSADSCFTAALTIASGMNDSTLISDIKTHLGILYCEQEKPEEGITLFKEAMNYYEKTGNTEAISDAALNIGVVLKMAGKYDDALEYIRKSTDIEEGSQRKSQLVIRYYNLADLYLEMNDKEKAYEYCQKTMTIANEIASKPFFADCNFLMGKYFMLEKNYRQAISHFKTALVTALKNNEQTLTAGIYLWNARALYKLNRNGQVTDLARKAYENALKMKLLSLQKDAALLLSENFQKTGKTGKALTWYKIYHNISDSINFFRQQKEISRIEARYNYEKKEHENELLRSKASLQEIRLKNRTITMIVLALAIILSVVVIILLISRIKYTHALNREQKMISLRKLDTLNQELEGKKRELTAKMMFLNQKNELIGRIIQQLQELQNSPDINYHEVNALVNELRTDSPQGNWKEFETQFTQVHPGFYKRLYEKYPALTSYEQRIAAFLRMNLNTKEISVITGRTSKSIEVTRSRIRKKLGLSRQDNLNSFLASV
ncbi:MAG: tetratricopeptide repeat protein [Chlorobi bacterium]|nr:tetratricopeptide repeat protein [Chlorobiota bacterium]